MKRARDSIPDDRQVKRARQELNGGAGTNGGAAAVTDPEAVYVAGKRIYDAVMNAQDKAGRTMADVFLTVPNMSDYPDYYQIIKHPIALDDISAFLERRTFRSLEAVKVQFDTMFKNAKKYNVKESQIWRDAKTLQKLVNNEYKSIMGIDNHDDASDDDGKKTANSTANSNLQRVMKTRLAKLTQKTDADGRLLAGMFMELPSRQEYDYYYKVIKKPLCFNQVATRVKNKQYQTLAAFNADISLIFSNAMEFNTEDSQIYEDAVVLKEYFRQLTAAESAQPTQPPAPAPVIPEQSKIKLKLPTAPVTTPVKEEPAHSLPSTVTLQLPVALATASAPKPTPIPAPRAARAPAPARQQPSLPVAPARAPSPKLPVALNTTQTPSARARAAAQAPKAKAAPAGTKPAPPAAKPAVVAGKPPVAAAAPVPVMPTPMAPPPQLAQTPRAALPYYHLPPLPPSAAQSQIPSIAPQPPLKASSQPATPAVVYKYETPDPLPEIRHPLARAIVQTLTAPDTASTRTWKLNYRDGVATWTVRLVRADKLVRLGSVQLRENEGDDDDDRTIVVKLNGRVIERAADKGDAQWEQELGSGLNVLEFGTSSGQAWKVYMDRPM